MQVKIFDTEINIKEQFCSLNGCKPSKIKDPYINVYVRITNHCNFKCKFCEFSNNKCDKEFDPYKMFYALSAVAKKVKINKVSFTGGEATLDSVNLCKALHLVKEIDKDIFTVLHTNGYKFEKYNDAPILDYIDSISLSRHHYDNNIVNEIFNGKTSDQISSHIANFSHKKKIHLSCNLIKGYIDSQAEMIKYLEHASDLGISDVGFVSLMNVNKYCEDHFIDFSSIQLDNNIISKIRDWNMSECCKCANYLYLSNNNDVLKVYSRYYMEPDNKSGNLVYDIDCLKDGFNGEPIFI